MSGDLEQEDEARPRLAPERPSAPGAERLDQMIFVTRPRAWVGLAVIAVLLGALVAWSLLTELRVTEDVRAVAIPGGSYAEVASSAAGVVTAIEVTEGDSVRAGQVVGTVTAPGGDEHELVSPVAGSVADLVRDQGASVDPGDLVIALSRSGDPLVRLFPAIDVAQGLSVGDTVFLEFAAGDSGGLEVEGTLTRLSPIPSDQADAIGEVGSPAVGRWLVGDDETVVSVDVRPDTAEARASLATAATSGPSAVTGTATIVVGTRRPIDYVGS